MTKLENDVRAEIEALHRFFVCWFNGTIEKEALEANFGARLHPDMHITFPDGNTLDRGTLLGGFANAHASNPAFRIDIRGVKIVHEGVDTLLVSYEEWQIGAKSSEKPNTARISTALISKQQPFVWFNIHETWLPDDTVSADPFDF